MYFNILDGVISNLDIERGVGSKGKYAIPTFQLKGVVVGDFVWLGLPQDSFEDSEDVISDGDRMSVLYKGKLKNRTIAMAHYNYRTKKMYEAQWKIGLIFFPMILLMWAFLLSLRFELIQSGEGPIKSFAIVSCVPLFLISVVSFEVYKGYAASKALKMHCRNARE
jgi:hypothetical protein